MLLDIGLQEWVDVAKVSCQLVPRARIILITQNTTEYSIRRALSSETHAYILKGDAGSELLPAINATLCERNLSVVEYWMTARWPAQTLNEHAEFTYARPHLESENQQVSEQAPQLTC